MDPVSLAASILTLITASNATVSGLTRLWSLRRPPPYLDGTINEVTDFKAMLHLIHTTIESAESDLDEDVVIELRRLLDRAKAQLDAVHTILGRLFKDDGNGSQQPSLKAKAKLREVLGSNQQKFESLRQDLASIKSSLSVVLATTQIRLMPSLLMKVQQVTIVHTGTNTPSSLSVNSIQQGAALIENIATSPLPISSSAARDTLGGPHASTPLPATFNQNSYLLIRTKQLSKTCSSQCRCQCHSPCQATTPRWLRNMTGALFFRFTGTPLLSYRSCNISNCGSDCTDPGSLHFQYYFPSWLLSFGIEISATFKDLRGPGATWSIKIPRTVLPCAKWKVISVIKDGSDVDLQKVMAEYRVTAIDLLDHHCTLLEYALYRGSTETVNVLLRLGADLSTTDVQGRALGHLFWRKALNLPRLRTDSLLVEQAPQLEESLSSMGLSTLHKALFGLHEQDLKAQLMINPSSVHDVDVHGWTALHWAAQNADEPGLDILIAAGSNVNAISRDGTSVLMMAAQARSATCCQKLIDAGADVQFREQHGNNALSFGLRCADVVLLLLRHGVDVNFTHIFGYSCLHHAIETADPEICKLLLDYGADTEALDAHGESPAFWAVRFNKPASVKLLYERGAVLNRPSEHGKSVIHYAAAFGGLEVMQILEEARIEGLSMTPDDVDRYWYWFYMNRPPYFVGERPPIEVEEERFLALLDSVIGNKSDEATITNELPQLPGNFPKEVEIFEQEQNNLTDDDDEYEFLDAVES